MTDLIKLRYEARVTRGAIDLLKEYGVQPYRLLDRFARGDWGLHGNYYADRHRITQDIRDRGPFETGNDAILNCLAVEQGGRIIAAYLVGGDVVWVIHYVGDDYDIPTTILLPGEH